MNKNELINKQLDEIQKILKYVYMLTIKLYKAGIYNGLIDKKEWDKNSIHILYNLIQKDNKYKINENLLFYLNKKDDKNNFEHKSNYNCYYVDLLKDVNLNINDVKNKYLKNNTILFIDNIEFYSKNSEFYNEFLKFLLEKKEKHWNNEEIKNCFFIILTNKEHFDYIKKISKNKILNITNN